MSINDATKLPDGSKCPAFALVVRNRKASKKDDVVKSDTNGEDKKEKKGDNKGEKSDKKNSEESDKGSQSKPNIKNRRACRKGTRECLLVIRGSASSMDWSINMDDVSVPFSFKNGSLEIPTEVGRNNFALTMVLFTDSSPHPSLSSPTPNYMIEHHLSIEFLLHILSSTTLTSTLITATIIVTVVIVTFTINYITASPHSIILKLS